MSGATITVHTLNGTALTTTSPGSTKTFAAGLAGGSGSRTRGTWNWRRFIPAGPSSWHEHRGSHRPPKSRGTGQRRSGSQSPRGGSARQGRMPGACAAGTAARSAVALTEVLKGYSAIATAQARSARTCAANSRTPARWSASMMSSGVSGGRRLPAATRVSVARTSAGNSS